MLDGGVAEWSIAAVLKTAEPQGSGGSNPSLSASALLDVASFATTPNSARNRFTTSRLMARAFVLSRVNQPDEVWWL